MGKDDFTGRSNIGTGRRQIAKVIGSSLVDPGLADVWDRDNVTSQPILPPPVKMVKVVEPNGDVVERPDARRETPVVVEDAAIAEFLKVPVPASVVEQKYGLRRGYLGVALRRRYGDVATLKRALQGTLLESALVLVEHAMLNVEDMTPAQAMLGAKIATDASVTIEKSIREAPRTIDFGQLADLGEGLSRIHAFITGGGVEGGGLVLTSDEDEITRD